MLQKPFSLIQLSERNLVPKSQSLNTFPQSLVFNSSEVLSIF